MFTIKIQQFKILIIFFVIVLFSCQKEEIQELSNQDEITVQDGKLKFNNLQQFSTFIGNSVGSDYSTCFLPKIQKFEKSGFISLVPLYDVNDEENINYYFLKRGFALKSSDLDEIPLDSLEPIDEYISDPYFAALLNDKREIQIADMVYKYTEYGVFYTLFDNLNNLYKYISENDSSYFQSFQPDQEFEVASGIYFFRFDYSDSYSNEQICIECNEDSKLSLKAASTKPNVDDLKVCSSLRKTWLTSLVGPSAHCDEHFTDKARIHVKVWNQNYGVYSSLGINVDNEYKRLGIWWSNKTEELELGYSFASFKYPGIKMNWPQNNKMWVKYDGYKMDQDGNMVSTEKHPSSFFTDFPIKDEDKTLLEIYVWDPFNGRSVVDITGKDVNGVVNSLTKQAGKAVWNYLKKELGSPTTIVVSSEPSFDVSFTYTNWKKHKSNENRITEIFDWNTGQIGFKYNFDGSVGWDNVDYTKIMTAKSYKEARIMCYGMGRRGDTWKGVVVDFKDIK